MFGKWNIFEFVLGDEVEDVGSLYRICILDVDLFEDWFEDGFVNLFSGGEFGVDGGCVNVHEHVFVLLYGLFVNGGGQIALDLHIEIKFLILFETTDIVDGNFVENWTEVSDDFAEGYGLFEWFHDFFHPA